MDTNYCALLRTIRYCKREWLRIRQIHKPQIGTQRYTIKPSYEAAFRLLQLLAGPPLYLKSSVRIYLESTGSPGSKVGVAADEFIKSATNPSLVYFPPWGKRCQICRKLARIIVRLPRALFLRWYVIKRAPHVAKDDLAITILLARDAYMRFLKQYPQVCPVIISDLSSVRYLLGTSAALVHSKAIWYQQDFHFVTPPPFPVAAAVVMSSKAVDNIHLKTPSLPVYSRPIKPLKRIQKYIGKPRVGIAVNATFRLTSESIDTIDGIRKLTGAGNVVLRLHPRVKPITSLKEWLVVAPFDEPLAQFLQRIDIAFVGNSAFQIHAIAGGVPVVHVQGLDIHGYDAYGYVRSGVIFGMEFISPTFLDEMWSFYSKVEYMTKLCNIINPPVTDDVKPLTQLYIDFFEK